MAFMEKMFPLHLSPTERNFLLQHCDKWIAELRESGPEGVRQANWLSPAFERLRTCSPEEKMLYEWLITDAKTRDKSKDLKYVMVKVSKRTHMIIKLESKGEYRPSLSEGTSDGLPDQLVMMQSAKPVTKNMQYTEAVKVYAFLVLGLPLPPNLEEFILVE